MNFNSNNDDDRLSYTPGNIELLEDAVLEQVQGKAPYHFDTVRTLIKLYQLFPPILSDNGNDGIQQQQQQHHHHQNQQERFASYALLLAMPTYPQNNDRLALSYMIPSSILHKDAACNTLQKCSDYFQACQFVDFWKLYKTSLLEDNNTTTMITMTTEDDTDNPSYGGGLSSLLLSSSSLQDPALRSLAHRLVPQLQQAIISILALSYKEAPISIVLPALDIPFTATATTTAKDLWNSCPEVDHVDESAGSIIFHGTSNNTKRQRVYQEGVSFHTIATLLNKMAQ